MRKIPDRCPKMPGRPRTSSGLRMPVSPVVSRRGKRVFLSGVRLSSPLAAVQHCRGLPGQVAPQQIPELRKLKVPVMR